MTASDPHADLQTLPRGWRNLWRAHVTLPEDLHPEEFTIFVRGADRDDAHLAIRNALNSMFPSAAPHLDNDYYNLTPARDLVREGVSERHVDRLFESGWMGDKVEGWVRAPVFVVPEAPALYAAWMTAQLDHSSQYASLALVPAAGIVAGNSAPAAQRAAKAQGTAAAAPKVTPIRHHNGFLIAGDRLVIKLHPSSEREQISVGMSATAEATGGDRGVLLGLAERYDFAPDDIRIEGDVLSCTAQSPFMARYAPEVTDYREGFTVTLEPGQARAVRQAVAQLRRVLAGQRAVVEHLQPWLDSVKPSAWYVEKPVFDLVVARVLDGADHAAALTAFDRAAHTLPAEARQRVADPALWAALDRAVGPAPI
jgi:hypothetical protein